MRIFSAVEFDGDVKTKISELQKEMRGEGISGNFTNPDNLHLTLKFLGEIEQNRLNQLKNALEGAADEISPFEIAADKCGFFTSRGEKTIWLGMTGLGLAELAESAQESFAEIGFEREKRKFTPHVTLARRADCDNDLISQLSVQNIKFSVSFATLFESRRDSGKLWYKPLFRVRLNGEAAK